MKSILKDKNLYYIGGVVRDELLGLESFDIDLTYFGNAIEFAKTIPNAEIMQINEPFGTVHIKLGNFEIDIASTRCETYPKVGHLPEVSQIGCSLKDDVLRRDFTINALAKSTLDGEIVDYTNGIEDIKNKTLRVLHDKSFIEDPTRILRALKFSIRFNFKLDENTRKLQDEYLKNVNYDMSYKRLKKELIETFNLNKQEAFDRFISEKIYKLLTNKDFSLPSVNFEKLIDKYNPTHKWIIYVGILPEVNKLPLTKVEAKIIEDYNKLKSTKFENDFQIHKEFSSCTLESCIMYANINEQIVKHYLKDLQKIKIELTGEDLINLGLKPSAKFSQCFDYVLEQKIKNQNLTKADEMDLAKDFFKLI